MQEKNVMTEMLLEPMDVILTVRSNSDGLVLMFLPILLTQLAQ
jgi:hypothetical protein